jgi:hypothetical protein
MLLPYDLYSIWYFMSTHDPLPTLAETCHLFRVYADQAQNHPLANRTEKITAKETAPKTMNLTRWTQVLTQMLHGVAGT